MCAQCSARYWFNVVTLYLPISKMYRSFFVICSLSNGSVFYSSLYAKKEVFTSVNTYLNGLVVLSACCLFSASAFWQETVPHILFLKNQ